MHDKEAYRVLENVREKLERKKVVEGEMRSLDSRKVEFVFSCFGFYANLKSQGKR